MYLRFVAQQFSGLGNVRAGAVHISGLVRQNLNLQRRVKENGEL